MRAPSYVSSILGFYFVTTAATLVLHMQRVEDEAVPGGSSNPLFTLLSRLPAGLMLSGGLQTMQRADIPSLEDDFLGFLIMKNCQLAVVLAIGLAVKTMFLGRLTSYETGKIAERVLRYMMMKIVFMSSVLESSTVNSRMWPTWFMGIGYLKVFTGLARDRFESLLSSPSASLNAHTWTFSLLVLMLLKTVLWFFYIMKAWPERSTSVLVFWIFDVVILGIEILQAIVKYGVQLVEKWLSQRSGEEVSWGGKGAFLFHTELIADIITHVLMLCHYVHLKVLNGIAIHFIDAVLLMDVRFLASALYGRVRLYLRYRTATNNLHQFRDAAQLELEHADDCAICKETMQAAKVLPCSHIFHLACLRAWLQQSGSDNFSCPLCRLPLFQPMVEHGSDRTGSVASRQPHVPPAWQNLDDWFQGRRHPLYDQMAALGTSYEQGRLWTESAVFSATSGHQAQTSQQALAAHEGSEAGGTTDAAAAAARQSGGMPLTMPIASLISTGEVTMPSGTMAAGVLTALARSVSQAGQAGRRRVHSSRDAPRGSDYARPGVRRSIGVRTPLFPPSTALGNPAAQPQVQPGEASGTASPGRASGRVARRRGGLPVPQGGNATMFWSIVHCVGQRLDALASTSNPANAAAGTSSATAAAQVSSGQGGTSGQSRQWPDSSTIAAVKEVLPHAPSAAIVEELQRTRDVNRAVESLIAAGLM